MNFKQKLCYIALGAAIFFVGALTANLLIPTSAQVVHQNATWGRITCTGLDVVSQSGEASIRLDAIGGLAAISMRSGSGTPRVLLRASSNEAACFMNSGFGNVRMDLKCYKKDAEIYLEGGGGEDRRHIIELDTYNPYNPGRMGRKGRPNYDSDDSFGIFVSDGRIVPGRVSMTVDKDGQGGFEAYGYPAKHLWNSPRN